MSSSPICVDASIVVRLVTDQAGGTVPALWENWITEGRNLLAPALLFYEVCNALHRYQHHNYFSREASEIALAAVLALPISLHGELGLHRRALALAHELGLPAAYDAHYLALAEQMGAELWTADRRLARSVEGQFSWVHPVT